MITPAAPWRMPKHKVDLGERPISSESSSSPAEENDNLVLEDWRLLGYFPEELNEEEDDDNGEEAGDDGCVLFLRASLGSMVFIRLLCPLEFFLVVFLL